MKLHLRRENAIRRLLNAADLALSEYPLLAAPDGRINVDLDDLITALGREDWLQKDRLDERADH